MKNIERPVEKRGRYVENGKTVKVFTHDIPGYFNKQNMFFINFWRRWKIFGNPWNTGWATWPYWAIEVIETLEECSNLSKTFKK